MKAYRDYCRHRNLVIAVMASMVCLSIISLVAISDSNTAGGVFSVLAIFMWGIFPVLIAYICDEKKEYKNEKYRLNDILNKIREDYPLVTRKYNLPSIVGDYTSDEFVHLLNKKDSEWAEEEGTLKALFGTMNKVMGRYPFISEKYNLTDLYDRKYISKKVESLLSREDSKLKQEERELALQEEDKVQFKFKTTNINNGIDYVYNTLSTVDYLFVNYDKLLFSMQGTNWHYPVTKFPNRDTFVFPYFDWDGDDKGFMDDILRDKLEDKLSDYGLGIFNECALLLSGSWHYTPDVVIIDKENPAIRIDVEIDEPYSLKSNNTNEPTHYIGGRDALRDRYVNEMGWIVVRFTEHQVASDIDDCVAYVADLIYGLNRSKRIPKDLRKTGVPKEEKRWLEYEAREMTKRHYREGYLKGYLD